MVDGQLWTTSYPLIPDDDEIYPIEFGMLPGESHDSSPKTSRLQCQKPARYHRDPLTESPEPSWNPRFTPGARVRRSRKSGARSRVVPIKDARKKWIELVSPETLFDGLGIAIVTAQVRTVTIGSVYRTGGNGIVAEGPTDPRQYLDRFSHGVNTRSVKIAGGCLESISTRPGIYVGHGHASTRMNQPDR
ncbi:uncharacterized protein LOC128878461 isoform X2 [Hylaeus volcanicus]|uniref:uncharacterized protein LOC128878461 isoform X2 n=1 Tax=Hylaeus volcanicus TaxID=313075 RepID=UPI0023B80BE3|nr:uncharacterized protein LOC128878461 isoform X2 [Hylaeus volcanicus]